MIKIVLDAMGSDNYPTPDVVGAVMAAREYGVEIILVGDEDQIKPILAAQNPGNLPISIVHAPEMLTMEDKGLALALKARRANAKNSIAVGLDLVKNGQADAFVTAGNTGAVVASAYFRLGTIPGVDLPALAPVFPTSTGSCIIMDIGANPDCKPENLYQFAVMGSIYAEKARKIKNPKIGLISNGEEEGKGNQLVRDALPLIKGAGLNFFGNVEGKEVIGGKVDVAVTDGFTGNVLLKSTEAVAKMIIEKVREYIKGGVVRWRCWVAHWCGPHLVSCVNCSTPKKKVLRPCWASTASSSSGTDGRDRSPSRTAFGWRKMPPKPKC
jgi:glycerol-3-phosphate acyltransferase PlsX